MFSIFQCVAVVVLLVALYYAAHWRREVRALRRKLRKIRGERDSLRDQIDEMFADADDLKARILADVVQGITKPGQQAPTGGLYPGVLRAERVN